MSDEHDRTRAFDPGLPGDGNHPPGGPRSGDAGTRPMPRVPADATRWGADAWNADSGEEPVWAGRATVRAPRPTSTDDVEWSAEPTGRWWTPIVVGFVVLVLLGLLGWAIWLIARAAGAGEETPVPIASATQPAVPATATRVTTATAAPTRVTTTTPQVAPTTATEAEPATVIVPALKGLAQQEAQQALDRRGLSYRVIVRAGDGAAGTVIDSDPAEGQEVPAETQVTLVVVAQRPSGPASSGPSSAAPR